MEYQFALPEKRYSLISDRDEVAAFLEKASRAKRIGFDIETTGFFPPEGKFCGISFGFRLSNTSPVECAYIPVHHASSSLLSMDDFADMVVPFLMNKRLPSERVLIAHNASFEWSWFKYHYKVEVPIGSDTMLLAFVDDPNRVGREDLRSVGLKELGRELFGVDVVKFDDICPKGKSISVVPASHCYEYGCQDSFLAWAIDHFLHDQVYRNCPDIARLEHQLWPVLAEMKARGVYADTTTINEAVSFMELEVSKAKLKVFELMGYEVAEGDPAPIELNSPTKVSCRLFDELGLKPFQDRRNKSGVYPVNRKTLEPISNRYPVIAAYLAYKGAFYLLNNFLQKQHDYISPITGAIHGDLLQCGAPTGRFASARPNLQNVPKGSSKSVLAKIARRCYVSRPGFFYIDVDYSQIELRCSASITGDRAMLSAYEQVPSIDLHSLAYSRMYGVSLEVAALDVNRKVGKCVHPHTIVWGTDGPFKLSSVKIGEVNQFITAKGMILNADGEFEEILESYNGGSKELLTVVARRGLITCTPEHRLVLENGTLKRASDIVKGDVLSLPSVPDWCSVSYPIVRYRPVDQVPETVIELNDNIAYFSGVFLGDGTKMSDHSIALCYGDVSLLDSMGFSFLEWQKTLLRLCLSIGMTPVPKDKLIYLGSRQLMRWMEALELIRDKRVLEVPSWILKAGNRPFLHFWAGLVDTDGAVGKHGGIEFTSKDCEFVGQLAFLLRACGMLPYVAAGWNKVYSKWYYRIHLSKGDSFKLKPYMRHRKRERLEESFYKNRRFKPNEVTAVIASGEHACVDVSLQSGKHLYVANGLSTHNTINFGLGYGMSELGLAWTLNCPLSEAKEHFSRYFRAFTRLRPYIESEQKKALELGYVRTHFGRRRNLTGLYSRSKREKDKALRSVFNTIIQGSAADIIKIAMVRIYKKLREFHPDWLDKFFMILQVHDELLFEIHETLPLDEVEAFIKECMELVIPKFCPVSVDFQYGYCWGDLFDREQFVARFGSSLNLGAAEKMLPVEGMSDLQFILGAETVEIKDLKYPCVVCEVRGVMDEKQVKFIQQLLRAYSGSHCMYLKYQSKLMQVPNSVNPTPDFLEKLNRGLRRECTTTVYTPEGAAAV